METIEGLPPEARFLLRAVREGLALQDAGARIALDESEAAQRLRAALVRGEHAAPAASAGSGALLEAAAPLIAAAGRDRARAPSTACLPDAVAAALGNGRLAGPLLLASAEHAADCTKCLDQVLAHRRAETPADEHAPRRSRFGPIVIVIILLLLVAGAAMSAC